MKKRISKLVAVVLSMYFSAVFAGPQDLAAKHNCMGCHAVDKKVVGPSFKDIAGKYKGKGAEADLVKKVKAGGSGVWGPAPMPPSPAPEGDVKQIVDWIMTN